MPKTGSSSISSEWCRLENGLAEPVDRGLSKFLGDLQDRNVPIGIDLSAIGFIEPASMIIILAIYSYLKRSNRPPTIQFPTDSAARKVMGNWKFLNALKIIGHPAILERVDETGTSPRQEALEEELRKSYLPIRVICGKDPKDRPNFQHVDDELTRINEPKIMAWLQTNLGCPEGIDQIEKRNFVKDTFPSRIVFEAMMNSVRHPEATMIVTTSHILWSEGKPDEGFFTCIWWDDGKGIVETLGRAIGSGKPFVSSASPLPEKQCSIKIADGENKEPTYVNLTTNFIPKGTSTDAEILFSSICSRITRDPHGIRPRTKLSDNVPADSPLRQPGMGLYILVDCAVNIFNGSVSFRTGNLFMNVKRGNKRGIRKADYAISISRPSPKFNFPGNMLVVRLPIQRQAKVESTE